MSKQNIISSVIPSSPPLLKLCLLDMLNFSLHNFEILQTLYAESVPEDALPGKLIMQVSATDADIRSNAEITYTLHGTGAEKFRLTPDTGNIILYTLCKILFTSFYKMFCICIKTYMSVVKTFH